MMGNNGFMLNFCNKKNFLKQSQRKKILLILTKSIFKILETMILPKQKLKLWGY